ncbi:MAG: SRPBCC domain-containing protein [Pseudomonadota bacterium]
MVTTRLFAAPRDVVFAAWTVPKHLGLWWGSNGFTTTIRAIDVRPAGARRL